MPIVWEERLGMVIKHHRDCVFWMDESFSERRKMEEKRLNHETKQNKKTDHPPSTKAVSSTWSLAFYSPLYGHPELFICQSILLLGNQSPGNTSLDLETVSDYEESILSIPVAGFFPLHSTSEQFSQCHKLFKDYILWQIKDLCVCGSYCHGWGKNTPLWLGDIFPIYLLVCTI